MQRHPQYTRDRIAQVGDRIRNLIHADTREPDRLVVAGPVDRIPLDEAEGLTYRDAELGECFGPLFATYWFTFEATVPEEWAGERVDLIWITHSEGTLWVDGRSVQGLNTSPTGWRPDALLLDPARGGERIDLRIELACNGKFGQMDRPYATLEPVVLDRAQIARFDVQAWDLHHDFDVLRRLEADAHNGLDPTWAGELLSELNRICNVWVEDDRSTWAEAHAILAPLLERRNATRVHELSAIGHAHIDTIWLWPAEETYRKTVRTFSSQTAYMDRYPEFRFACSQAQQYDWIKRRNPDLWERIKRHVAEGRWIPVGGTWVEPDCNLPSGESLVRQFLYGQRFFEREFGRRCREFWNPDVFGYNGQLPQIMRGAGIDRFLTQKLSWNRFNPPPHHTFTWQGIDGSQVLAHFPPADTYNATAEVEELRRGAREYKDHDRSHRSLYVFGFGDGGGGPTPGMLETLRRASDLQGLPRTRMTTAEEFFDLLVAETTDLPTIVGELYFELHRGTYTTQAAVKRGNRSGERALHDADFLSAVATRLHGAEHPTEQLGEFWRQLLLNQFHDVLPGSSIAQVYDEAAQDHVAVLEGADGIVGAALHVLAGEGDGPTPANTLGFARSGVVERPGDGPVWVEAPPYGYGAVRDAPGSVTLTQTGDLIVLENERLRVELGRDGAVHSLIERATGREALAGRGNVLQVFDDRPTMWDAWDVDPFHLETAKGCAPAQSCSVVADDGLRAEVAFERLIGRGSTMQQLVRLDAGSGRLEFHCDVDWRERNTFLKVLFPVDVHSANATYQMQFGHTERPTHFSTSHDLARFEVPGHRFADLSEHGFGVALLTDCKYGYSTLGNEMRISLLRGTTQPDPEADQGRHTFAYAVVPHAGGWREAGVVAEAARFETPLRWAPGAVDPHSFFEVDDPNLVLDTVKRAEDSDALVLRLYEAHGGRGVARLRVGVPFGDAVRCSLLEDPGAPLVVSGGEIEVPYRPHDVVSVLLGPS
ncbi:MAG: alpha-mannosidase [Gaiellales bacterium]|jgi:alpha-mannosidase|nr:alpha-mannosidase [Gaiellales bacterium]